MRNPVTIGLFGTCGESRWRDVFVELYSRHGISFFNPQVAHETWDPDQAGEEAWHLANDALVLFPITNESYALGSLAETGFSSSDRWSHNRFVVIYVAPDLTPALYAENQAAAQGSKRARKLVLEHLKKTNNPNVFVAYSMAEVLAVSLKLYGALALMQAAREPKTHDWKETVRSTVWYDLESRESAHLLATEALAV